MGYNPLPSDVWSLGVVGFVMVTNRMPFDEKKPNNVIVELQRNRQYVIPPSVYLSSACKSSFEAMMTFDVRRRPTSTQCLTLPWIAPHMTVMP
uniref:Protein kinase domain-containing protein n=1 Tax=Caenorhabditis japonica TaxID=281687 RepID=A0A8R1J147_CAEJA